jgi:hypothetical protein
MHDAMYEEKFHNLTIKIYPDDDARSPDEDGDDGLFLVGYHRDFTVDRGSRDKETGKYTPGISQELAQNIARGGEYEDGSVCDEAAEYIKKYHIFGLEAYIHSGVSLALSREGNFPDRQWDVSQLGFVFASKKEWRMRKSAEKAARGLVATWNDYLSGNVYGYVVEDADGEHLDSCWGYFGDYKEGALKEGRSIAEWHYKDIMKKRAAKVKSYIKNRVPLQYREA